MPKDRENDGRSVCQTTFECSHTIFPKSIDQVVAFRYIKFAETQNIFIEKYIKHKRVRTVRGFVYQKWHLRVDRRKNCNTQIDEALHTNQTVKLVQFYQLSISGR